MTRASKDDAIVLLRIISLRFLYFVSISQSLFSLPCYRFGTGRDFDSVYWARISLVSDKPLELE